MSQAFGQSSPVEVLRAALESERREIHTATPGIVVKYNASTKCADVQPAINRMLPSALDEDLDVAERLPVCPSVPVMWPRGRGFSCVGTLSPGDTVLLVFCERDYGAWYETNDVSDPEFAGLHALQGAVAIPGFVPRSNPIPVPTDAAALASEVAALIADLRVKLNAVAAAVPASTPYPNPADLLPATIEADIASAVLKLGS